jgi:two-component system, chemotaxis family, CheB/CheR fusion protein
MRRIQLFQVFQAETTRSIVFELGNGQWEIPGWRSILENMFTNDTSLQKFEVEHLFDRIGQKTMVLNGWKIITAEDTHRILLSIEIGN